MTDLDAYRSGSAEPWTVDVLCALIRAKKPHVLIETGTFEGRTSIAMFHAMEAYASQHGALLWTLENDRERILRAFERIKPITTDTYSGVNLIECDALEWLRGRPDNFCDFVFLDDDHTAAHVGLELDECLRIVRPGGLICGHDVVGPFGLDIEFKKRGGVVLEFERLHAAGGLGLLTK